MLVLSRHSQEEIIIGNDIRITVLDVRKGRVRLGLVAPGDVHIVRGELLNRPPLKENEGNNAVSRGLAECSRRLKPGSAA